MNVLPETLAESDDHSGNLAHDDLLQSILLLRRQRGIKLYGSEFSGLCLQHPKWNSDQRAARVDLSEIVEISHREVSSLASPPDPFDKTIELNVHPGRIQLLAKQLHDRGVPACHAKSASAVDLRVSLRVVCEPVHAYFVRV